MNRSSAQHNLESLTLVAYRLDDLCRIFSAGLQIASVMCGVILIIAGFLKAIHSHQPLNVDSGTTLILAYCMLSSMSLSTLSKLNWGSFHNNDDKERSRKILDFLHQIEKKQEEEDTAMLIRLVKIRQNLWT